MALVPGVRPILEVGGRVFTDLSNLIELAGQNDTNANTTLRSSNSSSGYQVTVGKTLKIKALRFQTMLAVGSSIYMQLAQTDNDVGLDSSTAFTNPVYHGGAILNRVISIRNPAAGTVHPDAFVRAVQFSVNASKYCSAILGATGANSTVKVWGYEE